jgi:hypothetical protein
VAAGVLAPIADEDADHMVARPVQIASAGRRWWPDAARVTEVAAWLTRPRRSDRLIPAQIAAIDAALGIICGAGCT